MRYILSLLTLTIILSSCNKEVKKTDNRPEFMGKSGEVMIIVKDTYKEDIAPTFIKALNKQCKGLFGREVMFNIKFFDPKQKLDMVIMARNIIEVKIGNDLENKLTINKDHDWAKGQLYILIESNSSREANIFIDQELDKIIKTINDKEEERVHSSESKNKNKEFTNHLLKTQNIDLKIPVSFQEIKRKEKDFIWAYREKKPKSRSGVYLATQHLFVYNFPYNDSLDFTVDGLLWKRDIILKEYVAYSHVATSEKAYLKTTSQDVFPVYSENIEFNGKPAVFIRGNFGAITARGRRMGYGGYFVFIAVKDVENNRIVVFDGCANVPDKFLYREYLREFQAYFNTAKILN